MNLSNIHNVYFIGIGGIGMSALARFFLDHDKYVAGYDKTPSTITTSLESIGVEIHFDDNYQNIPQKILHDPNALIVYTPAIPNNHTELNYLKNQGFVIKKRSEVLGDITQNKFTIAVGGTHGKTSTTSLITHLLTHTGIDCYALVGGIMSNYNTNYISPKNKKTNLFIVEADEFDRSFLRLSPDIAIINSTDPDHLDIYGDKSELESTYQEFANRLKKGGILSLQNDVKLEKPVQASKKYTFGFEENCDFRAFNINVKNGAYYFDIRTPDCEGEQIKLDVAGDHNVLNLLAAMSAVCKLSNADLDKFIPAIESYMGVKRRFEYIIKNDNQVFIDDYAHHPTELTTTINSVKKLFPKKEICGVFQPHLYSRTQDFAEGFAKSLEALDTIILLEIYPARELPIEGVDSQMLLDKINHPNKMLLSNDGLLDYISTNKPELLLTLGAGDIDRLVKPLKDILNR